jgi:cell division protein FtsQ
MTPLYQGRALKVEPSSGRRGTRRSGPAPAPSGPVRRRGVLVLRVAVVLSLLALLAHLPWALLRRHWAVVASVQVDGLRYLARDHVLQVAGLSAGQDLFRVDLARARQALLLEPRIGDVRLERSWPRGIAMHVQERTPVLLVDHGVPWEIDSAGVLLPPLAAGVEADVPLVAGPHFERWPPGARLRTAEVDRALAWIRALSDRDLQLGGQLSEVDVSDPRTTGLTLMSGTRVLSAAWPPDRRTLSALRVVLADLKQRGTTAQEVDMRFEDQIIVRPAASVPAGTSAAHRS